MSSSCSTGVEGVGSGVAIVGTLGVGLWPGAFRAVIYHHLVNVTKGNYAWAPTSFRSLSCSF